MYGYSMVLLFLITACIFFNCTVYFIYLVTPKPKSSKSKSDDKRNMVVIKSTNNELYFAVIN